MGAASDNLEITREKGKEEELNDHDATDLIFKERGCCFWIPYFGANRSADIGSGSESWERIGTSAEKKRWWTKGWDVVKKVKEWSEKVAGPRWKTFIRRFNRKVRRGVGRQRKYHYDPMSYALNFDEGHGPLDGNSGGLDHTFSVRYASLPTSAKSSMDIGRDGPDFTMMPSADAVAANVRHG